MPDHIKVKVNNVSLTVTTRQVANEKFPSSDFWKIGTISGIEIVGLTVLDLKELVLLAGHDWNKIDPAVPQDFADAHKGERYCWSYENDSIFGKPLSHTKLWYAARENVFKAVLIAGTLEV